MGAPKLCADLARKIFTDPRPCRIVAREYGVSHEAIAAIRRGQAYREATRGLKRSEFTGRELATIKAVVKACIAELLEQDRREDGNEEAA